MLSLKQKREYVEAGGISCPSCKSERITTMDFLVEEGSCHQSIHCEDCGLDWKDMYKLVDIEEE